MAYQLLVQTYPLQGDASFFSIDGGTTWSAYISQSFETQTTVTLQVKSSAPGEGTTTWYFWGWTDEHKGFDRKVVVNDEIQLIANISTSPKPVNKIVLGGSDQTSKQRVLLDLSSDTVDPLHLAQTYTAHDKTGAIIKGNLVNMNGVHIAPFTDDSDTWSANENIYLNTDGSAMEVQVLTDNFTEANIKSGVKILGKTGTYTSDATLNDSNLLPEGIIGYGNATKYTGTATKYSATTTTTLNDLTETNIVTGSAYVQQGVQLNAQVNSANIINSNIKGGITILGVTGTCPYVVIQTTEPVSGTSEYQYTIVTD